MLTLGDMRASSRASFRRLVKHLVRAILFVCITGTTAIAILIAVLEAFPGLLAVMPLEQIKYYALKKNYLPDSKLVLVYRDPVSWGKWVYVGKGDLFSSKYGSDTPPIPFAYSYDVDGFRYNSAGPPWQIILVGDSYLEDGETDLDTFSEHLKEVTGMATRNLGRAFYGPYQYVEVLKRYARLVRGQYVLFCFFDGNDIADIREYQRWQREGRYHFYYDIDRLTSIERYVAAFGDTVHWLRQSARGLRPRSRAREVHPDLAVIRLRNATVPMAFMYWNWRASPDELLALEEWGILRQLLADFKQFCFAHEATPVVLYIPTKLQVYGRLATAESGRNFRAAIQGQLDVELNSSIALDRIARVEGIKFINLLPPFQRLAQGGELLYYPFDTHWNSRGREAAAQSVAEALETRNSDNRAVSKQIR